MSRFVIVSTLATSIAPPDRFAELKRGEQTQVDSGCAWLFRADPGVEDAEEALRGAISDFFNSAEGQRVRESEQLERIGWCDAIPWVSDELWQRYGLAVFRHSDVTRILLDDDEDLAEDLPRWRVSGEPAVATPVPSP